MRRREVLALIGGATAVSPDLVHAQQLTPAIGLPSSPAASDGMRIGAPCSTYWLDSGRPDDSGNGVTHATAKKTLAALVPLLQDNDVIFIRSGGVFPALSVILPRIHVIAYDG